MEEKHKNASEGDSVEQNLSKDYIPKSKIGNLPMSSQVNDAMKEKMKKTQEDINEFKEKITKKYKFMEAIGIIPAQASKKIEEEYEIVEEDSKRELIHLLTIIPEKQFKNIKEIRIETINIAKKINKKFWVHVMTPVDIWNLGLDSKFDVMEAISMSFPILDKGLLASIRVAQIHKSLVLKKFEKYVTSYVISGSLTRGDATKTSDVDIFIIIDDTDVKRMPRLELKEKLRSIIYSYIQEAQAIAGVKNILNVQTYLMTEFWDSVKDAHPVMFTFIRDGVPLYDRGAFLPWKSLLRMGKIKPSPEAIDMFMSSGNKLDKNIERRILDIAVLDIYWGVLTPSQGILMLYGLAPSTPKETIKLIREVFYEKEKVLEEKYVKIIESIVQYYKDYEHGKNEKMTGTKLDKMTKDALEYMKRLRELREQIEKRVQENSIEKSYKDVFGMLGSILKRESESLILKGFDKNYIKEGKLPPRFLENLKFIAKVKNEFKNPIKKSKKKDDVAMKQSKAVEDARKFAAEIINTLIEYNQRCDFLSMDRTRFLIKGRDHNAEIFFLSNTFLVQGSKIQKISGSKLVKSDTEELKKQLLEHKNKETKIESKDLEILKQSFGDFDLVY
ncbi:MAG: nucleotidyltransferase domain-containing protein [archaeon]